MKEKVQVCAATEFIYLPPIHSAQKILVKPNLGYPVAAPVTVSMQVLGEVLQGLRRSNPGAEILIVEGVCSPLSLAEIAAKLGVYGLLDPGMVLLDADELAIAEYENLSPAPVRFKSMFAPALLREVDFCLSVGCLKRTQLKGEPLISASLKNLYGLLPRSRYHARSLNSRGQLHRPSVPLILQDVYFSIGYLFGGGVVDAIAKFHSRDWQPDRGTGIPWGKVFYGDDLIAVDQVACELGDEPLPGYLHQITQLRSQQRSG
ncbi:MAG: DUF362 domain-containing protein [Pseudanabaenaceae cyanobacterium bins.68]|nr:DUF362 domain-containing protein [Pseudanabaenaceae cyanobacterium bins.68]